MSHCGNDLCPRLLTVINRFDRNHDAQFLVVGYCVRNNNSRDSIGKCSPPLRGRALVTHAALRLIMTTNALPQALRSDATSNCADSIVEFAVMNFGQLACLLRLPP
ncbi:Uncharacterised protein [Mycobacteroides abscessus subsp. abscessus]|nr:Uncharacterised protein [Mycobacteroides abscessus subsp. abscessus]